MTKERQGEIIILFEGLIWAFFPIITVLSFKSLPGIVSLALSTFIASIFFLAIVIFKRRLPELLNWTLWKYVFGITLWIGVLYYSFAFYGLTKTTAGNAGIIALFEIFTSYIFFQVIRREPFSREAKTGSVLMLLGALIVLLPNFSSLNTGDIFILLATCCAPMGNLLQQKAKLIASTESILFLRSILAVPFLLLLAYALGEHMQYGDVKESLIFLLLNGLIILGFSKILWLEAISRISVTKALALSSLIPFFTLLLAWLILGEVPTLFQITSLLPLILGVLLLTNNIKLGFGKNHETGN